MTAIRRRRLIMVGAPTALILVALGVATTAATLADSGATGSITGAVTAPRGDQVEETVCAVATPGGKETCATTIATNINVSSPGEYRISGLANGDYYVRFSGVCWGEPCPSTFPTEYYDEQISLAKATVLDVRTPEALKNVDAVIEDDGERGVREYLENEGTEQPSETRSFTLPGAIEPLPVNEAAVKEFYATHPWDEAAHGIALADEKATAQGSHLDVTLHCGESDGCDGSLTLTTYITERKTVRRAGRRVVVKHTRRVIIGKASFTLAAGASEVLHVSVNGSGAAVLRAAKGKRLTVDVSGANIERGALVLDVGSSPSRS